MRRGCFWYRRPEEKLLTGKGMHSTRLREARCAERTDKSTKNCSSCCCEYNMGGGILCRCGQSECRPLSSVEKVLRSMQLFHKKIGCKSCNLDLHPIVRRRRDSNPRNVAVQQFSRLPPSTTRPHLHFSFLNRAAKIGIISKPAKLSEGAEVMKGSTADYQKETDSGRISNKVRSPQSFPVWTASTRIVVQGSHLCFNSHVAF